MKMNSPTIALRPAPVVEPVAAPFWQALNERRLIVQWCNKCQRSIFYPRIHCPHCLGAELTWRTCSGNGVLHAFTTVHRSSDPYFKSQVPYVVGLVALEEGVTLMSNIVGLNPDGAQVQVGMKLRVDFRRVDDTLTLHEFRPTAAPTDNELA